MPAALEIRAALPRTSVGKLSKKELIEEERRNSPRVLQSAAPMGDSAPPQRLPGAHDARRRHRLDRPHADRQGVSRRLQHDPRRRAGRPCGQACGRARRHRPRRGRGRGDGLRHAGAGDRAEHRAPVGDPGRPAGHGVRRHRQPLLLVGPADHRDRGAAHHRGRSRRDRRRRPREHQPVAGRRPAAARHGRMADGAQAGNLDADDRDRRHRGGNATA